MALRSWKSAVNGNWSGKANWNPATVPVAADEARITVAGTYDVNIDGNAVATSLLVNNATATVNATGTLKLATLLSVTAGNFQMAGGTINGGTIQVANGATFQATTQGGTLDGVTLDGVLNITDYGDVLAITDGLTLANAGGTGPGTINLTGQYARLNVYGSTTLDNATVNIGSSSSPYSMLTLTDLPGTPATLTFGTTLNMKVGGTSYLQGNTTDQSLVNNGTIAASITNAVFSISGFGATTNNGIITASSANSLGISASQSFTNTGVIAIGATNATINAGQDFSSSGTITVGANGDLTIYGNSFTNAGTIAVSANGDLAINGNSFGNTGTISVAAKGLLELQTNVTTTKLLQIAVATGGTVEFNAGGVLLNQGKILAAGTGTLLLGGGGAISGGTVNGDAITVGGGGTLNGVKLLGTLDVGAHTLSLVNGIGLAPATGAIKIGAGGLLRVRTDVTSTQMSAISTAAGGTISLETGMLQNVGKVLALNSGTLQMAGGTISGGTVRIGNGAGFHATAQGGTLDGVTLNGVLNMTDYGDSLATTGGLKLANTGATGPGTINLTGQYARLNVYGSTTLDNATVNIGSSSSPYSMLTLTDLPGTPATLTFGAALNMKAGGTAYVQGNAADQRVINNGTINAAVANASFNISGFGKMTNNGKITASTANNLAISNSLSFANAGTITVSATNATINGGQDFSNSGTITVGANGDLTIYGNSFINTGTIAVSANGNLAINGTNFGNAGSISVAPKGLLELQTNVTTTKLLQIAVATGGTVEFDAGGVLLNQGKILTPGTSTLLLGGGGTISGGTVNGNAIAVGNGGILNGVKLLGTLNVGAHTLSLVNGISLAPATGAIKIGAGGLLRVRTDITAAQMSAISSAAGGTISLETGILQNAGKVLILNSGTLQMAGGTISGGTVRVGNGAGFQATAQGGTLDGVTLNGVLNMADYGDSLATTGGLTLANTGATGPGTINLTGQYARLNAYGSTTLDNATINIGSIGSPYSMLNLTDLPGTPATLTFGTTLNMKAGGTAYVQGNAGDQGLVNNGTITAAVANASFNISGFGTMVNNGKIAASTANNLTISTPTFTNTGVVTISTTTATISPASQFVNGGTITVGDSGDLTIGGGAFVNTGTINVAAKGLLEFQTAITPAQLSQLTVAKGGVVALSNPATNKITLNGTYTVPGGTLFLSQGILGTGTLTIGAGTTLELGSTIAATETIHFAGAGATLRIDHPSLVNGTFDGLGIGSVLDLGGVSATGVTFSGNNITITSNTSSYTYSSTQSLAGTAATISSDGHGGSLITLRAPAPAAVQLDSAIHLDLPAMSFISGDGAETLNGNAGASDTFTGTSLGLDQDVINGWSSGDEIWLTDMDFATATQNFTAGNGSGVLSVTDGTHSAAMTIGGMFGPGNFILGAGSEGTMIAYHS